MSKSERKIGAANDMNVIQIKKKSACGVSEKNLISTTSKCNLITLKSFLSYKVKYFIDYNVGCLCQKLLSYLELKGYCKICHLSHSLRIFLFCKKVMFHSQVFVFLTIL